jgi:carboxymethylenebutenolidase
MDTSPVRTEWITLPSGGADAPAFDAFLAVPPAGTGPGLVLLQEIFGVNAHIRGVAAQYALAGFTVLAPDVFHRQQPRVDLGYDEASWQRARAHMTAMDGPAAVADIGRAAAALRARPEVASGVAGARVGAIGYCLGGRLAYLAAAHGFVDAAVGYYGGGIQGQLELAPKLAVPLLLHYGERDDHIPIDAVQRVREALAPRGAEVVVHAEAPHGFNCWARGTYRPAPAALALGQSIAFLARGLFGVA